MPRKANDKSIEEKNKKSTVEKKVTSKTADEKSSKVSKKSAPRTTSKATTKTSKKSSAAKSTSTSKSVKEKKDLKKDTKKDSKKAATKTSSKKADSKSTLKTKAKSNTTKSKTTVKSKSTKKSIVEYYDLPNMYNHTIVKILAQTPTILFVYWDISELDKQALLDKHGNDFFNNTTPFLVVSNLTKNYQFEVEINDYANSWYIHIPDSNCKYEITLIRKTNNNSINLENGYAYITSSNELKTPNDHILFETLGKNVFFKNVKNNAIEEKNIANLSFMKNIGRIYNIYDLYKEMYKNELDEIESGIGISSSFK